MTIVMPVFYGDLLSTGLRATLDLTPARVRFCKKRLKYLQRPYTFRAKPLAEVYASHWAAVIMSNRHHDLSTIQPPPDLERYVAQDHVMPDTPVVIFSEIRVSLEGIRFQIPVWTQPALDFLATAGQTANDFSRRDFWTGLLTATDLSDILAGQPNTPTP